MYARYFSSIYLAGARTKLLVCSFLIFGCVLGKQKESKRSGKEWKGFVHKHRDSFPKNTFAAFGNSAEGQSLSGWF